MWNIKSQTDDQPRSIFFLFVCRRFDDFDDAIDEAIEEDIGDLCGGEWMMWWLEKVNCSIRNYI